MTRWFAVSIMIVFMLESCVVYLPGICDSGLTMSHPPGEATPGTVMSVDLNKGFAYHLDESNQLARVAWRKVLSFDSWNMAFGGYLYAGQYDVTQHSDISFHGVNTYAGFGPTLTFNRFIIYEKFNLGAGADISFPLEFGPYTRTYRNELESYPGVLIASSRVFLQYNIDHHVSVGGQMFITRHVWYDGGFQLFWFQRYLGYFLTIRQHNNTFAPSIGIAYVVN